MKGTQLAYLFSINNYFGRDAIFRDGTFDILHEVDTTYPGSLVYCQNLHYLQRALTNKNVSAVICPPTLANETGTSPIAVILDKNPRRLFFQLYIKLYEAGSNISNMEFGIGSNCDIHPTATISKMAWLGNNVKVGPYAVIEDFTHIENDVDIGPHAIVGAEGLITLRNEDGSLLRVKHAGGVKIGEGSQILAGAIIAKSLFPSFTHIGQHCQIGIMTNIGHGVSIGDESIISGNSVIAGRVKMGKNVWVGTSSSVAQGLVIGDRAQIKMGSVVVSNIRVGQIVSGNFAVNHRKNMARYLKSAE